MQTKQLIAIGIKKRLLLFNEETNKAMINLNGGI
jgi:hypothetical protein